MKQKRHFTSFLSLIAGLFVLFSSPTVLAYNAIEYPVSDNVLWQVGMLVSLGEDGKTAYSSTSNVNYVGVVSAVNKNTIEVATNGKVQVLVTGEAGDVVLGSELHLSRIAGVASIDTGSSAIGVVTQIPTEWSPAKFQSNQNNSVQVGIAQVQLLSQDSGSSSPSSQFLSTLQKTGNGVAGRSVDMWRILTALIIGLGGLILSFGLLFISSRESFFSMGRNPMAGTIIMRGLWKVVALSVIIMCFSLGAAYAMLRIV